MNVCGGLKGATAAKQAFSPRVRTYASRSCGIIKPVHRPVICNEYGSN